ncbi:MAG: hypothetical protein DBX47_02795 [Clostridiales bacterium]|nr:MAG: hypothetical protein DBX47_02795 [Clostridiales bacterium]
MKISGVLYALRIKKMININEALRYLGYKGSDIPENVRGLIDFCEKKAESVVSEKFVYKKFELVKNGNEILFKDTSLKVVSKNLSDILRDCSQAYLLAVTVGIDADRTIREYMVSEPEKGVLLDSMFSVMADTLADNVQLEIERLCKKTLSFRFSPGYGDLSLSCQHDIIKLLDAQKKIGLFVTSSQMLTPTKSVTAILGVKDMQ